MNDIAYHFLFIGKGVFVTLKLLFGGICIGIIISTLLSVMCHKKILTPIYNIFISILRGTPILLQLSFFCFIIPGLLGIRIDVVTCGIVTLGINSSAYLAEIFRAGIESISKGQFEAAKSLHIPNFYMWKDIIFPQVFKNILPALTGECISLLKETAIISTVGGLDLMRLSQILSAEKFTYFVPLCIAGFYYYILGILIAYTGKKIEKRYDYN